MVKKEAFEAAFIRFLREKNADAALEVAADENLFNLGLLDSFAVPRLVTHLERELGHSLSFLEAGGLEAFFTIERAYELCSRELGASR